MPARGWYFEGGVGAAFAVISGLRSLVLANEGEQRKEIRVE
jgi:hypothetical protein